MWRTHTCVWVLNDASPSIPEPYAGLASPQKRGAVEVRSLRSFVRSVPSKRKKGTCLVDKSAEETGGKTDQFNEARGRGEVINRYLVGIITLKELFYRSSKRKRNCQSTGIARINTTIGICC